MILFVIFTWLYLQWHYMGLFRPHSKEAKEANVSTKGEKLANQVIEQRYKELGPMSAHELGVAILFLLAITLFFFRAPGFMSGWPELLGVSVKIRDATPAVFIVISFFLFPTTWKCFRFCRKSSKPLPNSSTGSLLTWKQIHAKTPWSLIFLLGSGFALAEGGKQSGMSRMLGSSLTVFQDLHPLVILLMVLIVSKVFSELASNVAIINVILPVVAEMARAIRIHPMFLMYPACLACNLAFHLPVGEVANIRTKDMAIAGIGPTLFTILTIWITFPTWGAIVYPEFSTFPAWAEAVNATT